MPNLLATIAAASMIALTAVGRSHLTPSWPMAAVTSGATPIAGPVATPAATPVAAPVAAPIVSARAATAEPHPKIRQAVRALQAAKAELQAAAHDFKGHRVDAIKAIDAAIAQLNLALQADP
jgi:hypothetical protein